MGVTGSGKTTVGTMLAHQLGWEFADADKFHPPANIEKMRQGIGLTDADRAPWLKAIHDHMRRWNVDGKSGIMACSALKHTYRKLLREGLDLRVVYLQGSMELIRERLQIRTGHYATTTLLASQFADLEEPREALVVYIDHTPEEIVATIRRQLDLA